MGVFIADVSDESSLNTMCSSAKIILNCVGPVSACKKKRTKKKNEWMNEWMDGWMDGRTDGRTNAREGKFSVIHTCLSLYILVNVCPLHFVPVDHLVYSISLSSVVFKLLYFVFHSIGFMGNLLSRQLWKMAVII